MKYTHLCQEMNDLIVKTPSDLDDIPSSLAELIDYKFPQVHATKIFQALHSGKSIGERLAVDKGELLYFYPGLDLYYTFSIGGRVFAFINKIAFNWTEGRKKTLKRRFLRLPTSDTEHMVKHIENIHKISSRVISSMRVIPSMAKGVFTVHMRDLTTPFAEIECTNNTKETIVIPLKFIQDAVKLGLKPVDQFMYAGQHIILFVNSDNTARVMYVGHRLSDSLFSLG